MTCDNWLKDFIKLHQPVKLKDAYRAGKDVGFTRKQIKNSRKWFGKEIETEMLGEDTFWRWDP